MFKKKCFLKDVTEEKGAHEQRSCGLTQGKRERPTRAEDRAPMWPMEIDRHPEGRHHHKAVQPE